MTFFDILEKYNREEITEKIYAKTSKDVERALASAPNVSLDDFMALVSPAADPYLENMAQLSSEITRRRFGNTMQINIPLYISNYCTNHCVYCGYNRTNNIPRMILSQEQLETEAKAIQRYPYKHILLVTGENSHKADLNYLGESIETMNRFFEQTSIEVQPLDTDEYRFLMDKGLHSVYVYQETYYKERYSLYHLAGKKSDFRYRLETPDRLGEAGIYKTGIANLIGLEEWRTEAFFTALHLEYLANKYWRTKYNLSFPRLRPFTGDDCFAANYPANERNLVQLICAYRLFSEDVEMSLSGRESPYFRNNAMTLGITSMSAGAKTTPGGYSDSEVSQELAQFAVSDERTPQEVVDEIVRRGLDPVWKDWDRSLFQR